MKHNSFILTTLAAAAALVLAACQQESIGPEASAPDQATEVIPVWVEGAVADDGTPLLPDTKMTVNATTGACAWETNDPVALYISGTGANKYVNYPVVDGSVRLSLASGQSRANYAIYPTTAAYAGGYSSPYVTYPSTYDMNQIPEANYEDWCPAPMVAKNTTAALKFYHVGALLKMHFTGVPSGTTQIALTFKGKTVTGDFSVTNAGTATAAATSSSSTNSTVTYTNLSISGSELYLNLSIPLGNYNSLTEIITTFSGGTSTTLTTPISGWGTITHGQGKKLSMNPITIRHRTGYDGRFNGLELSPGVLKWDTDHYILTNGDDPLELLRYYQDDNSLGVYWHQFAGFAGSLRQRLEATMDNSHSIASNKRYFYHEGLTWRIPSKSELESMISTSSTGSFLNTDGSGTGTLRYFGVLVDLSSVTTANGYPYDYSAKGANTSTGANSLTNESEYLPSSYIGGTILVPDNVIISLPGFTANDVTVDGDHMISYDTLEMLINGGCVFLPYLGYYCDGHWGDWGRALCFWSYEYTPTNKVYHWYITKGYAISVADGSNLTSANLQRFYLPVKLVR